MPSRWRAAHLWVTRQVPGRQRDRGAGNGQRGRKHSEQKCVCKLWIRSKGIWACARGPGARSSASVYSKLISKAVSSCGKAARINLSADGKHLSFLRLAYSPQVYVAEVRDADGHLGQPQRLSLDELRNYPYDWTPDGKSVLFVSDRNGSLHLFKQALDQPAPELLVGRDENVIVARLGPQGKSILFLLTAPPNDPSGKVRLMRIPLAGRVPAGAR